MNSFERMISDNTTAIIVILCGFSLIFLFSTIFLIIAMLGVQKRAERFFGSRTYRKSLEQLLNENTEKVEFVLNKYDDIIALVDNINDRLRFCVSKVGVVRYNPFDTMGSDLSFAVALMDEERNGVVLNTIHGREASFTYAKPLINAESTYTLSSEERKAISIALSDNKIITSYK